MSFSNHHASSGNRHNARQFEQAANRIGNVVSSRDPSSIVNCDPVRATTTAEPICRNCSGDHSRLSRIPVRYRRRRKQQKNPCGWWWKQKNQLPRGGKSISLADPNGPGGKNGMHAKGGKQNQGRNNQELRIRRDLPHHNMNAVAPTTEARYHRIARPFCRAAKKLPKSQ